MKPLYIIAIYTVTRASLDRPFALYNIFYAGDDFSVFDLRSCVFVITVASKACRKCN